MIRNLESFRQDSTNFLYAIPLVVEISGASNPRSRSLCSIDVLNPRSIVKSKGVSVDYSSFCHLKCLLKKSLVSQVFISVWYGMALVAEIKIRLIPIPWFSFLDSADGLPN